MRILLVITSGTRRAFVGTVPHINETAKTCYETATEFLKIKILVILIGTPNEIVTEQ
jgi:hypothetical protein